MNSWPARYYCSTCPVCRGQASRTEQNGLVSEFHCKECGSFEIARSAITTLAKRRLSHRLMWLRQVHRRNVSSAQRELRSALIAAPT